MIDENTRDKEIHLYLDRESFDSPLIGTTVDDFKFQLKHFGKIRTTLPSVFDFKYTTHLYAHYKGKVHYITLGKVEGTDREMREGHRVGKMILNGEFDWYNE